MDVDLTNRLVGNLSLTRWLTTAEAILLLYMSDHGLDDEQYETLSLLSKGIVQVYFHQFFNIKAQPSIVKGPYHLLTLLRLFRDQDHRVKEIWCPTSSRRLGGLTQSHFFCHCFAQIAQLTGSLLLRRSRSVERVIQSAR